MAASSTSTGFYQTIANGLGTDLIDLTEREIAPEILRLIPSGLARLHGALPVETERNHIASRAR